MAQLLKDLTIGEVSLVDNPSNSSTDPITGRKTRHAVVALWKRDDTDDYLGPEQIRKHMDKVEAERKKSKKLKDDPGTQDVAESKEKKMSKFKKILKSGNVTRDEICEHVRKRTLKIAKQRGVEPTSAILEEAWTPFYALHESTPVAVQKAEVKTVRITKAECELDDRARKLMKKTPGLGYGKAVQTALEADPSLYSAYESELQSGAQYSVPAELAQPDHPMQKSASDDGDECSECGEETDDGDKFCSGCGADLSKSKAKAKRKQTA